MINKTLIFANAPIKNIGFYKEIIKDADKIICADGGANIAKEMGIIPDYIIGDLDSIKKDLLTFFQDKTIIIKDKDQNKSDLELAIKLAESLPSKEIIIIGALGKRIDHTIANIFSLDQIKNAEKAIILDEYNSIELVKDNRIIKTNKNEIISILPISNVKNLCLSGFKWDVKNLDTKSGWFGLSNITKDENVKISFDKGKILVVKSKE